MLVTEAKRLGPRNLGGRLWEPSLSLHWNLVLLTGALHVCFNLSGEVRNNSTILPNLVLASSWEKKKWESALQLWWQYQLGSNAVTSHLSLTPADTNDSPFSCFKETVVNSCKVTFELAFWCCPSHISLWRGGLISVRCRIPQSIQTCLTVWRLSQLCTNLGSNQAYIYGIDVTWYASCLLII